MCTRLYRRRVVWSLSTFIKLFVQLTIKLLKPTLQCGQEIAQSRNICVNIVLNMIIYLPFNKSHEWLISIATIKKLKKTEISYLGIFFMSDFESLNEALDVVHIYFFVSHKGRSMVDPKRPVHLTSVYTKYNRRPLDICANIVCRECEQSVTLK